MLESEQASEQTRRRLLSSGIEDGVSVGSRESDTDAGPDFRGQESFRGTPREQ